MPSITKSVTSTKRDYYLSKHRYLELVHFCRQYDDFKKEYKELTFIRSPQMTTHQNYIGDQTSDKAIRLRNLDRKIKVIEQSAIETDSVLYPFIIEAVSKGLTYENLRLTKNIPCGRTLFYVLVRRFYFILARKTDC